MIDKNLVQKKIEQIIGFLDELAPIALDSSLEEILRDNVKLHAAERLFQLAVDAILDINTHIIKEEKLGAPDDMQSTFAILATGGILDENFAQKISPIAGLRNRMVHNYESLSNKQFIEELKKNYPDFKEYLKQIDKLLH